MYIRADTYSDYQILLGKFGTVSGSYHHNFADGTFTCGAGTVNGAIIVAVLSSQPASYTTDHPLSSSLSAPPTTLEG